MLAIDAGKRVTNLRGWMKERLKERLCDIEEALRE